MKHGVKLYDERRAKAVRLIRERHEALKLLNKARYHR